MKKLFQFIIITVPILLLMLLSGYYTYNMWDSYNKNNIFKAQLRNTKILQSLEKSVLNEIVCVATMSADKKLLKKVCNPMINTTNTILKQILDQKIDTSLYRLEQIIQSIRQNIKNSGTVAVEHLVNGDLDKELNGFIQRYTSLLNNNTFDTDKKGNLKLYSEISNISYASDSEKALVSYYLTSKKTIPSKNLIYWDKIITMSQILENYDNYSSHVKDHISKEFEDNTLQKDLRAIEDIRLDVMTNSKRGTYASNITTWVNLLNHKQKILHNVQAMLLDTILKDVTNKVQENLFKLAISLAILALSILALFAFILFWKKNNKKQKLLNNLLSKVSEISSDDNMNVSDDLNSYKVAYNYIASNYETLYDTESRKNIKNKNYEVLLNNVSYEIQTPLNAISGYAKLLKETNLNIEQNTYLSQIDTNFHKLDSILSKVSTGTVDTEQKLTIDNNIFSLMKNIESSVETFTIKADQKDIILGLYADPNLACEVKGDATKISHIIGTLIDNALEVSNAHDMVNIVVNKVDEDEDQIYVKFEINDQGIGYNKEELQQIISALDADKVIENIQHMNMKNLNITNKILKRMGSKVEIESEKGKGTTFKFIIPLDKDKNNIELMSYPNYNGLHIGLALPSIETIREVDKNLKKYIEFLGATFSIYEYETLFNTYVQDDMLDLLFVYHDFSKLEGELDNFINLPTKTCLLTSGSLRSTIDFNKYTFSSVVYTPITINKVVKIINDAKINLPIIAEKNNSNIENIIEEPREDCKKFENIHALVIEENETVQQPIIDILNKFNIKTVFVKDEKEISLLREKEEFNILFIDIEPSKLNAFEMISGILYDERIKHLTHLPIIGLVKDLNEDMQTECLESGIDRCLDKPLKNAEIYTTIQKYCIDLPKELARAEEDELIAKVLSGDFLKE